MTRMTQSDFFPAKSPPPCGLGGFYYSKYFYFTVRLNKVYSTIAAAGAPIRTLPTSPIVTLLPPQKPTTIRGRPIFLLVMRHIG